jgi:anti-anti-sigma factor
MLLEPKANFSKAFRGTVPVVEVEQRSTSVFVVRLREATTADLAEALAQQLNREVVQAARFVILDLTGLCSMSCSMLQTLVEFRRDLAWRGGEVWLAGLQPAVWSALRLANQDRYFSIRDSVAQVFAS